MKELSELMVDLAYSSLFLKNKELSNHVKELFEEIKELQDETLKLVFHVKISDEERLAIVDLLEYIKDYSNASANISSLNKNAPDIICDVLSESAQQTMTLVIKESSFINGKSIGECRVHTLTGLTIVSVKRDGNWLFNIKKDFKFKGNDLIVGVGHSESKDLFNKLMQGKIRLPDE